MPCIWSFDDADDQMTTNALRREELMETGYGRAQMDSAPSFLGRKETSVRLRAESRTEYVLNIRGHKGLSEATEKQKSKHHLEHSAVFDMS